MLAHVWDAHVWRMEIQVINTNYLYVVAEHITVVTSCLQAGRGFLQRSIGRIHTTTPTPSTHIVAPLWRHARDLYSTWEPSWTSQIWAPQRLRGCRPRVWKAAPRAFRFPPWGHRFPCAARTPWTRSWHWSVQIVLSPQRYFKGSRTEALRRLTSLLVWYVSIYLHGWVPWRSWVLLTPYRGLD